MTINPRTVGGAGGSDGTSTTSGGAGGTYANPTGGDGTGSGGGGGGGPSGSGGNQGSYGGGGSGGAGDPGGVNLGKSGGGGAGGADGFAGAFPPMGSYYGNHGYAGGDGSAGGIYGGGGGGGGAGGYGALASSSDTLASYVTGGVGGAGGLGGYGQGVGGNGGGGGGGGGGLSFSGTSLTVGSGAKAQGGAGGAGGEGGNAKGNIGQGGKGGSGGDGIDFTGAAAATLTNNGTISGGAGGAGGTAGSGTADISGSAGTDGAGVVGANLIVSNGGTISGGGASGDAIDFTGGANTLMPGTGTLNGNIAVDGTATTLAIETIGVVVLANAITGSGSITVELDPASTQFGGVNLAATNTYSGSTTIQGLSASKAEELVISGSIAQSTTITVGTFAILVVNAANALAATAAVTITDSTGQLDLAASQQIGSLSGSSGNVDVGASSGAVLTTGTDNTIDTFGGVIQDYNGAGALTKIGTGTFTLSGANTYSGLTTVSAGTLDIKNARGLGATSSGTLVSSGATLKIDGDGLTINEALSLSGTGVGNGGALEDSDTGSSGNDLEGSITLTGATRINDGNVGGGGLKIDGAISGTNQNLTLGGAGSILINSVINTGAGTLTKDGTGIVTLIGANSYTGATTVGAGTLDIRTNSALGTAAQGTVVHGGATLEIDFDGLNNNEPLNLAGSGVGNKGGLLDNDSGGIGNILTGLVTLTAASMIAEENATGHGLSIEGTISGVNQNLTLGGVGSLLISGAIETGTGMLTKIGAGVLTLSGANTYSGATTLSTGTLRLSNTSTMTAVASLGSGAVSVASGATLSVANADTVAGSFVVGNVISGAGSVVFDGLSNGITTLAGANTYTGVTTVIAGTLDVQNDAALGTTAAGTTVASGAALEIDGDGLTVAEPLILAGGTLDGHDTGASGNTSTGSITLTAASRINSDAGEGFTIQGNITGTGEALTMGGGDQIAVEGAIQTSTGSLTVVDTSSEVALEGIDTYTGATTIVAGGIQVLNSQAISNKSAVVIDAQGSLTVIDSDTVGSLAGDGTIGLVGATLTTGGDGTSTTFSGVIEDFTASGSLTKIGAGTQTVSGADTYSGVTSINAGKLTLTGSGSLADSAVTLAASTTFDISGVTSGTSIANLAGDGATSVVSLVGKRLTVSAASGAPKVEFLGAGPEKAASSLVFDMAATSFSLASATFASWTAGQDTITITGTASADTITGSSQNDVINGGAGADTMQGGAGNDSYFVDNAGDMVVEAAGGGTDTVTASVSYALTPGTSSEVENLVAAGGINGTAAINLTGNGFANTIIGDAAANVLNGGAGADTMQGGAGNDTYYVDSASDRVIETVSGGNDTVIASVSYTLANGTYVEVLEPTGGINGTAAINLTGNSFANLLIGDTVANVLNGGAGADTLQGGAGDDTYYVDNAADQVIEAANGGNDLVIASVSYALAAGTEVEKLWAIGGLTGTTAINLTGNALANSLIGDAAANVLNGGAGADTLQGGAGDDTYYVDNVADQVIEVANGGNDLVIASVSYALTPGTTSSVENLWAIGGITGTAAINLTGNGLANSLIGDAAANVLNGGGGADTMQGGAGNDTYYVDNVGDKLIEAANGGTDTVLASASYALQAGVSVEVLGTTGGTANTAAINLTGNALAQTIDGDAGDNVLDGGGGNDFLMGFGGRDTFLFDTAPNTSTNDPTIGDFSVSNDMIELSHVLFAALAPGALPSNQFSIGTAANSPTDHIVYNAGTGALLYDADGNGSGAAVQFAKLSTGLTTLTASNFKVI